MLSFLNHVELNVEPSEKCLSWHVYNVVDGCAISTKNEQNFDVHTAIYCVLKMPSKCFREFRSKQREKQKWQMPPIQLGHSGPKFRILASFFVVEFSVRFAVVSKSRTDVTERID